MSCGRMYRILTSGYPKTELQILAMATMFARDFVSRERSCACDNEVTLFGGTKIVPKEVWKKPH